MNYDYLIEYGFCDWQAKELLKYKKIETMHGIYRIKKDKLYLNNEEV